MTHLDEFIHGQRMAYFSMETALHNDIPTYSGGLGILAGDTMRSAVDLEIPMVGVSLVSRAGYFRQELDADGNQIEHEDPWEPTKWAVPLNAKVSVTIAGRDVWVMGWLYVLEGHMNGRQPVILLDTDIDDNNEVDRQITDFLYGGDQAYRLKQEIVLGVGGVRLLLALGFDIHKYHMNEGHSALLVLELLRRFAYAPSDLHTGESRYDVPRVREMCSFTTHTPVEAGHDKFSYDLVTQTLDDLVDLTMLKSLAGQDSLNMTQLALNMSEYVNGVAERHAELSRKMYPGYRVHAITNGVHPYTWTHAGFVRLYDQYLPGWCHEPELLVRADCCIPAERIRQAHEEARQGLLGLIQERLSVSLDPKVPMLGFARRMTAYKRPDMLFSDLDRLRSIAGKWPFQVVLAGKAHPRDDGGKDLIRRLHQHIRDLDGAVPVVYLPDYDMKVALAMVAGVDLWLNTPLRPYEASGTSGMKAAFNAVPSLSVLDGWWIEGYIEGVTGWAIGDISESSNGNDAESLYRKLEQVILPMYYEQSDQWTRVMLGAMSKNASFFNSHRMMRRYVTEAYVT